MTDIVKIIKQRRAEADAGIAAWTSAPLYPPNVLPENRLSPKELALRGLRPDYYEVTK